uniref:Lipoprotein n=1 Tax=Archangium gephyra TaxID=48 RepID=A0A3S7UUL4_9BACT|nr:lipoprotein [Archangium gephyra]
MKRVSFPWAMLALSLLVGCGTGAQRRTFPVEMTVQPMTGPNERGWTVTPESVHVSVGTVRFYEGRVLLSSRWPRFEPYALLGGTAWAHPGHYVPGDALGEVLSTTTVDLLATQPTVLGEANAVTGAYGSMELTLSPATAASDIQNVLRGHTVRVRGLAVHTDGRQVRFDAEMDLPKPIEGIRFERTLEQEAGRVRITVELARWLGRIDFATASSGGAGGVSTFPVGSQAMNALVRGVEDTSAYVVTWVEGATQ